MNNLKRIRESKRISQKELSKISGVSDRMIQYYEQGVKDINKAQAITVCKLAQSLECTVEDLLEINVKIENSKPKLSNQELADIFSYCDRLSRLVSPRDAKRYYDFNFDGLISDTLTGLAVMYADDGDIKDFKNCIDYNEGLNIMLKDIRELLNGEKILKW